MEYIRKQFYTLKERILEPRKFMQVLAGPRQVGKSTLVNQVLAQVSIPHTIEVEAAEEWIPVCLSSWRPSIPNSRLW